MNEQPKPNKKPFFYYAMIAMLILMLLNAFVFPSLMTPRVTEVSYDKFLDMLSGGQVTVVELQENERELYFKAADENGAERIYSTGVFPDADLQKRLSESGVTFSAVAPQENSTLMNFLFTWIFPTLILILPMVLLWRMMQKRMGDLMEEVEGPNLKKGVIRPLADVHETEEALVVTMDMPGVEKQDIDISVVEDELQISAQRKSETEVNEQDYHRRERTFTRFERRVLLPASIKTEEARATLTNGVLQITLPKVYVLTRKRIAID